MCVCLCPCFIFVVQSSLCTFPLSRCCQMVAMVNDSGVCVCVRVMVTIMEITESTSSNLVMDLSFVNTGVWVVNNVP